MGESSRNKQIYTMNLRFWLYLVVVVEISDCKRGLFRKKKKKSKKNASCLMTSIPVCKSVDLMPKYPCAQHDKRKDLKKPKGPVNAKEMVRFLNKERKYSAGARKGDKAHVCCSPKKLLEGTVSNVKDADVQSGD